MTTGLRPDLVQFGGLPDAHFILGDLRNGLQHIGTKRGADGIARVIEVVATGNEVTFVRSIKTVHVSDNGMTVILSLDELGQQKTWLLTGWEEGKPDVPGVVSAQSGTMQQVPTFSRDKLGAGLNSILCRLDNRARRGDDAPPLLSRSDDP